MAFNMKWLLGGPEVAGSKFLTDAVFGKKKRAAAPPMMPEYINPGMRPPPLQLDSLYGGGRQTGTMMGPTPGLGKPLMPPPQTTGMMGGNMQRPPMMEGGMGRPMFNGPGGPELDQLRALLARYRQGQQTPPPGPRMLPGPAQAGGYS